MAVRFHLPSKVYGHRQRGRRASSAATSWAGGRTSAAALDGGRLEFGAEMDERSILSSTVMLFAGAVVLAVLLLAHGAVGRGAARRERPRRARTAARPAAGRYNRASRGLRAREDSMNVKLSFTPVSRQPFDLLVVVLDDDKTLHAVDDPRRRVARRARAPRASATRA